MYPEIPNIPLPVRFAFVLLNPHEHFSNETVNIGRTMGALFADEVSKTKYYLTIYHKKLFLLTIICQTKYFFLPVIFEKILIISFKKDEVKKN